jgi:hypothetical protein
VNIQDCCISYELFGGVFNRQLMPHLALGKIDKIKVSTPLSDDILISALSLSRKLKMVLKQNQPLQYDTTFLKGCPTFGESNNLRKLIKKSISPRN